MIKITLVSAIVSLFFCGCSSIEYVPYETINPIEINQTDVFVKKSDVKKLIIGEGVEFRNTGGYGDIYYNYKLIKIDGNKVYLK